MRYKFPSNGTSDNNVAGPMLQTMLQHQNALHEIKSSAVLLQIRNEELSVEVMLFLQLTLNLFLCAFLMPVNLSCHIYNASLTRILH